MNKKRNIILDTILILALLLLGVLATCMTHAAESPAAKAVQKIEAQSPYQSGVISATTFASYRVHEFGQFDGELGVGLGVGYAITRNLTIEGWALGEHYTDEPAIDSISEAGAYLKFYAPIKESGFAPYAVVGYSRGIHTDANNMEAGIGLEYRFLKHLTAFADGVWVQNFGLEDPVSYAHAKFRLGGGFTF